MQFGAPYKIVMQGKVVAYFRGLQAMLDVKARTEERDQRWHELRAMAANNDDKASGGATRTTWNGTGSQAPAGRRCTRWPA